MYDWDEKPELNITPLVDVMLVLMAILMVTAPIVEYQEDINLPIGSQDKPLHKISDLTISIDKNRKIYVGKKSFDYKTFADDFVLTSKEYSIKRVVYIKADKELKYDDVIFILKVVKEAGFSKVSLITNG
jgi:biopolymer transport protein ExbD